MIKNSIICKMTFRDGLFFGLQGVYNTYTLIYFIYSTMYTSCHIINAYTKHLCVNAYQNKYCFTNEPYVHKNGTSYYIVRKNGETRCRFTILECLQIVGLVY